MPYLGENACLLRRYACTFTGVEGALSFCLSRAFLSCCLASFCASSRLSLEPAHTPYPATTLPAHTYLTQLSLTSSFGQDIFYLLSFYLLSTMSPSSILRSLGYCACILHVGSWCFLCDAAALLGAVPHAVPVTFHG